MNILDILPPSAIKVPLESGDKKGAIDELIELLAETGRITQPDNLRKVIWERELQRTTGIGEGLAIPHGKSNSSRNLVIAIGRPAQPIDFGSIDNKPVKLIVLLASPPEKTSDHIQALGKISRLMADPKFRAAAYAAPSADALYRLFERAEASAEVRR
ncbi:MAG: fructose PTS transporter subunit IIA [Phycisphaerales bacterium]|nr:fructose PTS transporter subunit IIA [Phycisphaerales bacterium]